MLLTRVNFVFHNPQGNFNRCSQFAIFWCETVAVGKISESRCNHKGLLWFESELVFEFYQDSPLNFLTGKIIEQRSKCIFCRPDMFPTQADVDNAVIWHIRIKNYLISPSNNLQLRDKTKFESQIVEFRDFFPIFHQKKSRSCERLFEFVAI